MVDTEFYKLVAADVAIWFVSMYMDTYVHGYVNIDLGESIYM